MDRNLNVNLRGEKFETLLIEDEAAFKIKAGGHMIFDGPPGRTDNVQISFLATGKGNLKVEGSETSIFTEDWVPVSAVIPSKRDFTVSVTALSEDENSAITLKKFSYKELGLFKEPVPTQSSEGTATKFKLYIDTADPEVISGLRATLTRYTQVTGAQITLVPEKFDSEIEDIRLVAFLRAIMQQTLGFNLGG